MVRVLAFCLSLFLSTISVQAAPDGAEAWNGKQIDWRTREVGLAEAKRDGKTAILVAQATWCPVCTEYRKVFTDARVVKASRDFVMILVDVDQDKEGDRRFAIDGTYVPRTFFLAPDGQPLTRFKSTNPDYNYYLSSDDPSELLGLMMRARKR